MPLAAESITFYYTGSATGPTDNTLSLGGTISAYTIPDATANNVFDDVTGDESANGDTEYRAIAVKDIDPDYDMLNTKVWIDGYVRASTGADTIYFALENPNYGATPVTIQAIQTEKGTPDVNKFTVKTGETVSWTPEGPVNAIVGNAAYGTVSTTLFFGTVNATEWFGIWLRRDVPAGASAFSNRSCTIKVQCETTASPIVHTVTKTYVVNWTDDRFYVLLHEDLQ